MWWKKLVGALVSGDSLAKSGADFIVHDVCDRGLIGLFQQGINDLVGGNAVFVLLGGK